MVADCGLRAAGTAGVGGGLRDDDDGQMPGDPAIFDGREWVWRLSFVGALGRARSKIRKLLTKLK